MAPTAAALSLDAAVGYSLAASLAYSPPAELRRGSGGYQQRLAPRLAFSQQVEVDRLRASATLFEMEEQDGVCVAFRGSTDLKNYLSMFNLFFEPSRLGRWPLQRALFRRHPCLLGGWKKKDDMEWV